MKVLDLKIKKESKSSTLFEVIAGTFTLSMLFFGIFVWIIALN